jgi:hypothetical protein
MSTKYAFEWRRPKVTVYRAATRRRLAVHLNRYPGVVIGIALQIGNRVVSLVWGRPGKPLGGVR